MLQTETILIQREIHVHRKIAIKKITTTTGNQEVDTLRIQLLRFKSNVFEMIEEKGNTSLNKNETVLKIDLPKKITRYFRH